MGVTVQVRDLDGDVQRTLQDAAAREGLSFSAYLRRELTQLARSVEVHQRADALNRRNALGGPSRSLEGIPIDVIVDITRENRGPLPS